MTHTKLIKSIQKEDDGQATTRLKIAQQLMIGYLSSGVSRKFINYFRIDYLELDFDNDFVGSLYFQRTGKDTIYHLEFKIANNKNLANLYFNVIGLIIKECFKKKTGSYKYTFRKLTPLGELDSKLLLDFVTLFVEKYKWVTLAPLAYLYKNTESNVYMSHKATVNNVFSKFKVENIIEFFKLARTLKEIEKETRIKTLFKIWFPTKSQISQKKRLKHYEIIKGIMKELSIWN